MASGDTKTEALLNVLGNGGDASQYKGCCNTKTQSYILDAIDRIQNVEDEVEELKNNPDVVDIVDTYADLQAYDTQHLTENDIIRVLQDETHSGNSTYYRFTKNPDTWTFIGEISGGGGVNVVQTPGDSQTDVMSQDATTKMIFIPLLANQKGIKIGTGGVFNNTAFSAISIGSYSNIRGGESVLVGNSASVTQNSGGAVVIGANAKSGSGTDNYGSIALGWGAGGNITASGMMDIGSLNTSYGYNNTAYRLITGVHDGQGAHDAVTVGQVNSVIDAINTALSTNIPHIGS